jgi:hypothetical protein
VSERSEHKDELIHPLARPFLWLDSKWLKSSLIWVFGLMTVALAGADFLWPRHEAVHAAEFPGFYAMYGFGAFVIAVFVGWLVIRGLLGREENFWDGEGHDD